MFIGSVHIQYLNKQKTAQYQIKTTIVRLNSEITHLFKPNPEHIQPSHPQAANTVAMYDQCVALQTQFI